MTEQTIPPAGWRAVEVVIPAGWEVGAVAAGGGVLTLAVRRPGDAWPHGVEPYQAATVGPGHTRIFIHR